MCGASLWASDDISRSTQELNELKRSIETLNANLKQQTAEQDSITQALDALEQSEAELKRKISSAKTSLTDLKSRQTDIDAEILKLRESEQQAQSQLANLVVTSYQLGRESGMKLLLNQQEPAQAGRNLAMYRYIMRARDEQIQTIIERTEKLDQLGKESRQKAAEVSKILESLEGDQIQLAETERKRRSELKLVKEKIGQDKNQIQLYQEKEKHLGQLLTELKRVRSKQLAEKRARAESQARAAQEAKKAQEIQKAQEARQAEKIAKQADSNQKQQAEENQASSAASASTAQARPKPTVISGFKNNRGKLPLPQRSRIVARFGQPKPESGVLWQGLMFESKAQQPVSAIYPGQVVYSDWFRGYGQLLVLDHGDGFMSLYGHNDQLNAELGEVVEVGQVVASSGTSGGLESPGLYFEIRYNGEPDNPLNWCRL